MHKLDEFISHSGVKGMKWGVRHDDKPPKGPERGKIGKHLDSFKRERQWHQALKQVHDMTTKEIGIVTRRVSLENSLKTLSKGKMATKKDKEDYLRRHDMSNEELSRKVSRLQAKEALHKAVKSASKEQRELGIKIAQAGGSLGVKYALKGKVTGKDILKDAYDAYKKPQESADKAQQDLVEKISGKNELAGNLANDVINKYLKPKKKS